jgi:hypothetical protein
MGEIMNEEDRIIIRSVGEFEARRQYIAGNTIWTSPISYGSRFEMYYLDAQCVQENTTAYVFDPKVDFDKDIKNPSVYYYTRLIYA